MPEITEIFILSVKEPARAEAVRARAKRDMLALDGVTSWRTLATTRSDKPLLFAEIFTFVDEPTAKRLGRQFSERPATKAFLAEVDEVIVGRHFAELPAPSSPGE